ncbi:MAG: hypothetical protein OMM_05023 [Candidatus Magnetoglobus multicellularis str. Araruama]|uniref:Leucine-rich repeat-containing N-terminal plant-type domain-containing protein n=1 Tax=Candidatus Magnetoglobus multicellularis str. Araruama TaxID=890399 RepID=A0A1V1NYM8_9BACT|nr:MAG: hypothetical protein OMM_05023 [Candidatus Magnetoglobus multicellularis str. Araruama]
MIEPAFIPESERNALIDIYNSTRGDYWKNNGNWLQEPGTECSWYGITCDNTKTTIISIDLRYNYLQGNVLNSFSRLENLLEIDLSSNHLNNLPESIGKLKKLLYLDLSNGNLTNLSSRLILVCIRQSVIPKFSQLKSHPVKLALMPHRFQSSWGIRFLLQVKFCQSHTVKAT